METFALRLQPGSDLKANLRSFVATHQIQAGFVLTAVGSLQQAQIRFAAQPQSQLLINKFEIISLVGTLSIYGMHLHMAIADSEGKTLGGHVDDGCIIYTTAEIVIGEISDLTFAREIDQQTGFKELVIAPQAR